MAAAHQEHTLSTSWTSGSQFWTNILGEQAISPLTCVAYAGISAEKFHPRWEMRFRYALPNVPIPMARRFGHPPL